MAKKKLQEDIENVEVDSSVDETIEETTAADSIEMQPSDASRAGMMAQATTQMAAMDKSMLAQVLAMMNSKEFAKNIPDNAADQNRQTVAMKGTAMKEDVAELFAGESLSEEFKEKTTVLFEAAVTARVNQIQVELEEQFEQKLEEQVEAVTETLSEQVDQYLSYVAEQWVKENEIAIESSLRNEMTESFISGLKDLFENHYMSFPEDKVDVVEALADKVDALEEELNDQINANLELVEAIQDYTKDQLFNEMSEGLALTQVDKFRTLCESVEFNYDEDDYKKKLGIIKEKYFGTKTAPSKLFESVDIEKPDSEPTYLEPQIASYAKAISRTIKK
jgi:methyltransferase-like protein